ncbi:MAG: hypothetical protein ACR2M3_17805 [Thermomicrobiales bacterium]
MRGDGGGVGVLGTSSNGSGVYGSSSASVGAYGVSASGYGVLGIVANGAAGQGVGAITYNSNSIALSGSVGPGVPGAYAGYFNGQVTINGDFAVTGSKSALVPHPDGSHRLLYCVESPEAWFEDFGSGTLASGKADIALDADFAALVDTKDYHVFLTQHEAEGAGLAVTRRDAAGFTVMERNKGAGGGTFSYRVVARRKGTAGVRLAKATLPELHPAPAPVKPGG